MKVFFELKKKFMFIAMHRLSLTLSFIILFAISCGDKSTSPLADSAADIPLASLPFASNNSDEEHEVGIDLDNRPRLCAVPTENYPLYVLVNLYLVDDPEKLFTAPVDLEIRGPLPNQAVVFEGSGAPDPDLHHAVAFLVSTHDDPLEDGEYEITAIFHGSEYIDGDPDNEIPQHPLPVGWYQPAEDTAIMHHGACGSETQVELSTPSPMSPGTTGHTIFGYVNAHAQSDEEGFGLGVLGEGGAQMFSEGWDLTVTGLDSDNVVHGPFRVTTDEHGEFEFPLPEVPGTYTLTADFLGGTWSTGPGFLNPDNPEEDTIFSMHETLGSTSTVQFEVVEDGVGECEVFETVTTVFLAGDHPTDQIEPGMLLNVGIHSFETTTGEGAGNETTGTVTLFDPDGVELWSVELTVSHAHLGQFWHSFNAPEEPGTYTLRGAVETWTTDGEVGDCFTLLGSEDTIEFTVVASDGPPETMAGSATGSGHTTFGGQTPDGRRFAFSAITNPRGEVNGEFQLTTAAGARIHGTVTCIRVMTPEAYGFRPMPGAWVARIGGMAGPTNVDGWAGAPVFFTVVDRGQGGDAAPDLISSLFSLVDPSIPVDQIHCDTGITWNFNQHGNPVIPVFNGTGALPTSVFPAERGNIQVRVNNSGK